MFPGLYVSSTYVPGSPWFQVLCSPILISHVPMFSGFGFTNLIFQDDCHTVVVRKLFFYIELEDPYIFPDI